MKSSVVSFSFFPLFFGIYFYCFSLISFLLFSASVPSFVIIATTFFPAFFTFFYYSIYCFTNFFLFVTLYNFWLTVHVLKLVLHLLILDFVLLKLLLQNLLFQLLNDNFDLSLYMLHFL